MILQKGIQKHIIHLWFLPKMIDAEIRINHIKDCQTHHIISLLVMLDISGMIVYLSILACDEDPSFCSRGKD